jgi:hypothetical protein
MPHLEFQAARSEAKKEIVTFDLFDQTDGVEEWRETFTCADDPGLMALLGLVAMADVDSETDEGMRALLDFFRALVIDDDWGRFRRTCLRHRLRGETLLPVIRGLMPALAGRPTTPSSSSEGLPSLNGASSTAPEPLTVTAAT